MKRASWYARLTRRACDAPSCSAAAVAAATTCHQAISLSDACRHTQQQRGFVGITTRGLLTSAHATFKNCLM